MITQKSKVGLGRGRGDWHGGLSLRIEEGARDI
jgi:hypothetical protein